MGSPHYSNILRMLSELEEYCIKYGEWPKYEISDNETQNKISKKLYMWLCRTGFSNKNKDFKFRNLTDENGNNIYDRIKSLYIKYDSAIKNNPPEAIYDEIQEYFNTYKKFPTYDTYIYKWLEHYGYFNSDKNFVFKDYVTKTGRTLEYELKLLELKSKSIQNEIERVVKALKDYYAKYAEWPRYVPNPKTYKERSANFLAKWLLDSNYYGDSFKYKYLEVDGEKVSKILDEIYNACFKSKQKNLIANKEQNAITKVEEIREYCEKYHEWPKPARYDKSEKGIESRRLYIWLNDRHYMHKDNDFTYKYVKNSDGILIKDILDDLYEKYAKTIRGSEDYIVDHYNKIKEFTLSTGIFPSVQKMSNIELEKINSKYYKWLSSYGFFKNNKDDFHYSNVIVDGNKRMIDALNELYEQYHVNINIRIIRKTQELIDYCEKYSEWPRQKRDYKNEKEKKSNELYTWLLMHNYKYQCNSFDYREVEFDETKTVQDVLDELYTKYGITQKRGEIYVLERVKKIVEFCLKYGYFPNKFNPAETEEQKESNELLNWLKWSNYNSNSKDFRYNNITYNGMQIKDLLDVYYSLYTKRRKTIIEDYQTIHKFSSLSSRNKYRKLYYYTLEYLRAVINKDEIMYAISKERIETLSKGIIDSEELFYVLTLTPKEQKEYFYKRYTTSSIANNNNLSLFYKNMFILMDQTEKKVLNLDVNKKLS